MPEPMTVIAATRAGLQAAKEFKARFEEQEAGEGAEKRGEGSRLLKSAVRIGVAALPGGGRSLEGFQSGLRLPDAPGVGGDVGNSGILRRNLERSGIDAPERAQANHQVPCNVMAEHPLGQTLREKLGEQCVDEARNGEFLPEDEGARAGFPDDAPMHRGSHPVYSQRVSELGDRLMEDIVDEHGSLEAMPAEMADKVFDKWIELAHEASRDPAVQTVEGKLR